MQCWKIHQRVQSIPPYTGQTCPGPKGSCSYLEGHGDLVSGLIMGTIGGYYMAYRAY